MSEDRILPGKEGTALARGGEGRDRQGAPGQGEWRQRDRNPDARTDRGNLARTPANRRIEQRLTVLPTRQPLTGRVEGAPIAPAAVKRRSSYGVYISFVLAVLLPMAVASFYYGWFASNQYVAEFRFAVQDATVTSANAGSNIMAMLGGGSGAAPAENYMVVDYLTSRQAVEELESRIKVRSLYARDQIDWWMRFNTTKPVEKFVDYWQKMVTSNYDMITGIATAQIRAFTPEDALLIANSLVTLSEELVNRISNRTSTDAVRFAEREVERAQNRLKTVRSNLTAYRNKVGVIDPATSVVASNSTVQQTLQASLVALETQLSSLIGRNLSPNSPAVQSLQNQIKATKEQLTAIEATVAAGRDRAGGASLSSVIGEYEQLDLERQFAQALVTTAMQALEQARANAANQHLYITPYVRPSMPESSTYPRRFFSVMVVGLIAFGIWLSLLLTIRSIRERFG